MPAKTKQSDQPGYLPKRRTGRPRAIGPKEKQTVYELLAKGRSLQDAADCLEIRRSTLTRAIKADPVFAQGIKKSTAFGKGVLMDKVIAGEPGWQGAAWMLQRKWWKDFKNRDMAAARKSENADAQLATEDPSLASLSLPQGAVPPATPEHQHVPEADATLDAPAVSPGAVGGVEPSGPLQDDPCGPAQRQD